jgi:glycosyltransferase involved in cell wall biosynthesis
MQKPLISIPIFTYNGEKFLREQLDSIFAQTYENIEVIACDDCSTDGTVDILKEYEKAHGLICYYNETNLGVSKNVAKALLLCHGDFIAPSDQDDIWKPEKLQILIDHIGENTLIYSTSTAIDESGSILKDFILHTQKLIHGHNNKAFFFDNCVSGHTILFKKELIDHVIPLPAIIYPDWWIAFVASTYGTIEYYEESLVYYRRHSTQMTKLQKKTKVKLYAKIFHKEQQKKTSIQRKIDILKAFSSLAILDQESNILLKNIIFELEKFSTVYFNSTLVSLLEAYKNEIFAMSQDTNYSKLIEGLARGIWYYRIKLYS